MTVILFASFLTIIPFVTCPRSSAILIFRLSPTFLFDINFRTMIYSGISDRPATTTCHGYWRSALIISLKSNFTQKRFGDFNRVKSSITKKSLIGVTKMSINVHLLDCLIGSIMRRHGTISSLIRIIAFIKVVCHCKSF